MGPVESKRVALSSPPPSFLSMLVLTALVFLAIVGQVKAMSQTHTTNHIQGLEIMMVDSSPLLIDENGEKKESIERPLGQPEEKRREGQQEERGRRGGRGEEEVGGKEKD